VKVLALAVTVICAALLAAGCGGGGSGGSNTTAPPTGGTTGGGTPKKATAPNAPAGSKVVDCQEGAADVEGLRATAVDCDTARATMLRWGRAGACALGANASRGSCSVDGFRCQAVKVDRGVAVSCAHPGGDVAFIAHKARSHF
jgi:hypothetical protein